MFENLTPLAFLLPYAGLVALLIAIPASVIPRHTSDD